MALCAATKANAEGCRLPATGPDGLCWAHSPENAEQRRRMASRAARSKPNREVTNLKGQLSDLYTGVLDGRVEPRVGAVLAQIAGARIRLVETERRIRETEELESRLELLEAQQQGGYAHGVR